jgi:vitamin B12 transporter
MAAATRLKERARTAARSLGGVSIAVVVLAASSAFAQGEVAPLGEPDESTLDDELAGEDLELPWEEISVEAIEVRVRARPSEETRMRESAEAVSVVDTERARRESADIGEVLAREQGVSVRRDGGLGSESRFSLNGLYDDQIRFFVDGVPLELAGYPFEAAGVPVNAVDRVEIYRGVVPIRFGADALGGAVDFVTTDAYETGLAASYQTGSYGTYRVTLSGGYRHEETGFVARADGYFDYAENDYDVTVEVPDRRGRLSTATVPRFHDGYSSLGGSLELGVVDQDFADRLLVRGFAATYEKELQHNVVMTVPYGEVEYGERVYGGSLRYEHELVPELELVVLGGYSFRTTDFTDRGEWVYDWFGRRVRERRRPGEITADATDQTRWTHGGLGRASLAWAFFPAHTVSLSLSPTFVARHGEERVRPDPTARDLLGARRSLFTFVSGIEYELNAIASDDADEHESERDPDADYRLQNIVFLKHYAYHAWTEEFVPLGGVREHFADAFRFGVGDGLRFRITRWLYAKASYELATRLPSPDEVFGDGLLVHENLELEPETSHNVNVGPAISLRRSPIGDLDAELNAFLRESERLIVFLGNDRFFTYQNVYGARSIGIEGAMSWTSPGEWVELDASATFQEFRNTSGEGTFGAFEGDRIPNMPWFFTSFGVRLHFGGLFARRDALEPFYNGRYVHDFFRSWESQGLREYKQVVDAQLTHSAGITYSLQTDLARTSMTLEVQNLGDARVFDNFGVERPGRALYFKWTGEM